MKKTGVIFGLAIVCVLLFIALSVAVTYRIAMEPMQTQIAALKNTIETLHATQEEQSKTIAMKDDYKPEDGKTPACYYEANQCRGNDGQNAVSTHTETKTVETVVKEKKSDKGFIDIRYSLDTRAVEGLRAGEDFYEILVPCQLLAPGCSASSTGTAKALPELGEL